jgi:probable phosphoglycerate mutase
VPKLTVIRHGKTYLNGDGRLRGWIDVPLNDEGIAEARNLPKYDTVYTSDLRRAMQTASIVSRVSIPTPMLRPWNVGCYAGQPGSIVHPKLVWYTKNSDVRVPFGETFNEFLARFLGYIETLPDCTIVTHYRNCKVLQAWDGGKLDYSVLFNDDLKTGVYL